MLRCFSRSGAALLVVGSLSGCELTLSGGDVAFDPASTHCGPSTGSGTFTGTPTTSSNPADCAVPSNADTAFPFDHQCEGTPFCTYSTPPATYFALHGGRLDIDAPQNSGWWTQQGKTIPPLFYKRVNGDFAILARLVGLRFGSTDAGLFTMGGLLLRDPAVGPPVNENDEHWIKYEWGYREASGGEYEGYGYLIGEKPSGPVQAHYRGGATTDGIPADTSVLGVCRKNGVLTFIGYYGGWIPVPTTQPLDPMPDDVEVGLTAARWVMGGTVATFEYVAFRQGSKVEADCDKNIAALDALGH